MYYNTICLCFRKLILCRTLSLCIVYSEDAINLLPYHSPQQNHCCMNKRRLYLQCFCCLYINLHVGINRKPHSATKLLCLSTLVTNFHFLLFYSIFKISSFPFLILKLQNKTTCIWSDLKHPKNICFWLVDSLSIA